MSFKIVKVGRSAENDIVINESTVSKFHLELFYDEEGNVFLTDKNSTNGTFVNNRRIFDSVKLNSSDSVKAAKFDVNWKAYIDKKTEQSSTSKLSQELHNFTPSTPKRTKVNVALIIGLIACMFTIVLLILFNYTSFLGNSNNEIVKDQPQVKKDKEIEYDYSCLESENDLGTTKITEVLGDLESETIQKMGEDITLNDEIEVGNELLKDCKQKYTFIKSGNKIRKLNKILKSLVNQLNQPKGFQYAIYLIESEDINAFTAGGKLFFTTAMYSFCNSDDEIAAVIGHEIYHNELDHIREAIQKEKLLGPDIVMLNQILTISFNQKKELDCDLHGIDLCIYAGYNACVTVTLWERMSKVHEEGEYDPYENIFRTHPYSNKRSVCAHKHILTNYEYECDKK